MATTNDTKFLSYAQYDVTLQRIAKTTGRTLDADGDNAFKANLKSSDTVLGSWTHPNNGTTGAKTLNTSNQVIKSLTFDKYGHVTGANQAALVAAEIPNLAASKITSGTLGVARGGTGLSTLTGAYRIIYSTSASALGSLAANTTTTKKFLSMTGNGTAGAAPAWSTLAADDIPNLNASKITEGTFAFDRLPALYIGSTVVKSASGTTALTGITTGDFSSYVTAEGFVRSSNYLFAGYNAAPNATEADTVTQKRRIYFGSTDYYIELDKDGCFHFSHGVYSDSFVSAGGKSGDGGSSGIDSNAMWALLGANTDEQINASHLPISVSQGTGDYVTGVSYTNGVFTVSRATLPTTIALSNVTGADDIKAIEALTGTSGLLRKTAANKWELTSAYATLASPTFTGTPKAPTATAGTNTTQIATTAFVKTAVDNAIAGVTQFEFKKVDSLPSTGEKGVIYLVSHTHETGDVYDEYIWVDSAYEKIGNTDIDLSGYWLKSDLIAITASENTALLNTYFPIAA